MNTSLDSFLSKFGESVFSTLTVHLVYSLVSYNKPVYYTVSVPGNRTHYSSVLRSVYSK